MVLLPLKDAFCSLFALTNFSMCILQYAYHLVQRWHYSTDFVHRQSVLGTCTSKKKISKRVVSSGVHSRYTYVSASRWLNNLKHLSKYGCNGHFHIIIIFTRLAISKSTTESFKILHHSRLIIVDLYIYLVSFKQLILEPCILLAKSPLSLTLS